MATATRKKGSPKPAEVEWGAPLHLNGCKPSCVVSRDETRPMLCHAYLREHGGAMWLLATDSYRAVALKMGPVTNAPALQEGWVPYSVLKLVQKGHAARQVSTFAWSVDRGREVVIHDIEKAVGTYHKDYPDFETLGVWEPKELEKDKAFKRATEFAIGFDPSLLIGVQKALGGYRPGCRITCRGPLIPMRVDCGQHKDERLAILMPVKVFDFDTQPSNGKAA